MAWKVSPLLVTLLLALNAVLIVYNMNSRKTKQKGSNISSGNGLHSKEFTPDLKQGQENRKFIVNEDQ